MHAINKLVAQVELAKREADVQCLKARETFQGTLNVDGFYSHADKDGEYLHVGV